MIVNVIGMNFEYVTKADRELPIEERTVFIFRQPTLDERMSQQASDNLEVYGNPDKPETGRVKTVLKPANLLKKKVALVKDCLVEIRNLKDSNGNEVLWKSKHSRESVMAALFPGINELHEAIIESSGISEGEEKN